MSQVLRAYNVCKSPKKVLLAAEVYFNESGDLHLMPFVAKAEKLIMSMNLNKEYLPITGDVELLKYSAQVVLGENHSMVRNDSLATVQCIGGSGAFRIGFEFVKKFFPGIKKIFFPYLTWDGHWRIAKWSGLEFGTYRYYDSKNKSLDYEGMFEDIKVSVQHNIHILCLEDDIFVFLSQTSKFIAGDW